MHTYSWRESQRTVLCCSRPDLKRVCDSSQSRRIRAGEGLIELTRYDFEQGLAEARSNGDSYFDCCGTIVA